MGTTFQTGDTLTEGVTRFCFEVSVTDAWVRAAIIQAISLMLLEENWFKQGDIEPSEIVGVMGDAIVTATFEEISP